MAAPSPSSPPNLLSPPPFRSPEASYFLRTCSNFTQLKQIHTKIIKHNLTNDQLLVRQLINLSSSFGETQYASLVFHQLQSPSTFTWNLMIRSLSVNQKPHEALLLFILMLSQQSQFDKFTFPFVIKACLSSSSLRLDCGRKVFDKMPGRSIVSWTTMLYGLVSNFQLDSAEVIFSQMPTRNVVSWTAMITAYVKNRRPDEAFQLFRRMQVDNVKPNEFTIVNLLQASTQLGSLTMGRWVHEYAYKNGFVLDCFLGTALIDMYSKCGSLQDARKVFDVMQSKSLATWNAMITSLGVHGCGEEALSLFEQMEEEEAEIEPDAITFVGVLSACANTGNVKDGLRYFVRMIQVYGITPIREHNACMIQLLEQALEVEKVSSLVDSIDSDSNLSTSFGIERTDRVNERHETLSQHHIMFFK
ncbi:Pentatricopeptide repeat-containing protein [Cardamine amara subsp. amara]|uniref:Pentatricopeptide repeat-containing protein n=1 Tax=Cardamine amara subsp. amara TaxID=228776 RepID=A0ABD1ATI3_CARAN